MSIGRSSLCGLALGVLEAGHDGIIRDLAVDGSGLLEIDSAMAIDVKLVQADVTASGRCGGVCLHWDGYQTELEKAFPCAARGIGDRFTGCHVRVGLTDYDALGWTAGDRIATGMGQTEPKHLSPVTRSSESRRPEAGSQTSRGQGEKRDWAGSDER